MNEINTAQQEILKLLNHILNSQDFKANYNKSGLKQILDTIVKHYPEVDSQFKKSWRYINRYKENNRISKRAAEIIDNGGTWKELHYEHIQPVSYTIIQLIELENPTLENIKKIMDETEVIILSRAEKNIIDGKNDNEFLLDGVTYRGLDMQSKINKETRLNALKSIGFEFDSRYANNKLK